MKILGLVAFLISTTVFATDLPADLAYSVSGDCAHGSVSFRALSLIAHDQAHTKSVYVYVYLNNDGSGSVSVDSQAPIATTWSLLPSPAAPDILNLKIEKLGTLQYISAQLNGGYPTIGVQTENSYFPDLPTLPANQAFPTFKTNAPFSISGQTAAAFCHP